MSKIQRFEPMCDEGTAWCEVDSDGDYVKYVDHLAEVERKKESVPAWHEKPTCDGLWVTVRRTDNNLGIAINPIEGRIDPSPYRWFGPIPEPLKEDGS